MTSAPVSGPPSVPGRLDLRVVLAVPLRQFVPWLASVLLVTWAGYPGVVCVTPMAWLIALRVGLVCVSQSASPRRAQRLQEAALAGALLGLLQGALFFIVVPFFGPIQAGEWAGALGLSLALVILGMLVGAGLALFTGYMVERRGAR